MFCLAPFETHIHQHYRKDCIVINTLIEQGKYSFPIRQRKATKAPILSAEMPNTVLGQISLVLREAQKDKTQETKAQEGQDKKRKVQERSNRRAQAEFKRRRKFREEQQARKKKQEDKAAAV